MKTVINTQERYRITGKCPACGASASLDTEDANYHKRVAEVVLAVVHKGDCQERAVFVSTMRLEAE